jgi:hypothetical protein
MTLRNLMTSLLALTLMVFVGGCNSDTDETSNLVAWSECYTAGFCSKAAELGYFSEAAGNIYAGQSIASSGCDGSAIDESDWEQGQITDSIFIRYIDNFIVKCLAN